MKLATIEKISEVLKHPNADKLIIYRMDGMGWNVISAEKFEVGQKVCYIQTDTIINPHAEFEFLRDRKFRIKPIKLRGEYSNGLIMPLETLEKVSGGKIIIENNNIYLEIGVNNTDEPIP